jgi:O-methyltransferase domain/Dimerisation domain
LTIATAGIGNVTPNPGLIEMAMAYSRSRILCAAARLGVADALGGDDRSIDELAAACQANPESLYRLLRALASLGVTEETAPGRFRLTAFGAPLRKGGPQSVWPSIVFWADLLADEWSLLTECVRSGKRASEVRDPAIPSRWSQDPEAPAIFRAVMGTAPAEDYMPVAGACDFSGSKVVADLGGGGGALLAAILELNPHLRGMLVDREPAIDAARPRFAAENLASRCELVPADLTQSVPPGADTHVLKHVLHGYRDEAAIAILRNCRAVLPSTGLLLIAEFVLPPVVSHADPRIEGRLMSDINMMAVTGGKERSEREFEELLRLAGFKLRRILDADGDSVMVENVSIVVADPV